MCPATLNVYLGLSFPTGETIDLALCQPGGGVMWSECSHSSYLSKVVLLSLCVSEGCFSLTSWWGYFHNGDLSMDSC